MRPAFGLLDRPALQVQVEAAHQAEHIFGVPADPAVGADVEPGAPLRVGVLSQPQVPLPWVDLHYGFPEDRGQVVGQAGQRRVVDLRLPPAQVVDQQIPDTPVAQLVAIDQLSRAECGPVQAGLQRVRRTGRKMPHPVQHVPHQPPPMAARRTGLHDRGPVAGGVDREVQQRLRGGVPQGNSLTEQHTGDVIQGGLAQRVAPPNPVDLGNEAVQQRIVLRNLQRVSQVNYLVGPQRHQRRLDHSQTHQAAKA